MPSGMRADEARVVGIGVDVRIVGLLWKRVNSRLMKSGNFVGNESPSHDALVVVGFLGDHDKYSRVGRVV